MRRALGLMVRATPFMTPAYGSDRPKSVVNTSGGVDIREWDGQGCPGYPTLTLMIDITTNATERKMVSWKRVFSKPRRVRMVEEAEPNSPPPPSFTCARMTTTRSIETSSCITFMNSLMDQPQQMFTLSLLYLLVLGIQYWIGGLP